MYVTLPSNKGNNAKKNRVIFRALYNNVDVCFPTFSKFYVGPVVQSLPQGDDFLTVLQLSFHVTAIKLYQQITCHVYKPVDVSHYRTGALPVIV